MLCLNLQLRDLGLESTDRPLELAAGASLPPSLTKLFAVESRLAQVPGALLAIAAQSPIVVPPQRTAGWPRLFGLPVPNTLAPEIADCLCPSVLAAEALTALTQLQLAYGR